ncbi:hypothetical protein Pr1d_05870 [Bythopirellula goksoeyrii]|uniref:Uncharacterized protein n=1 Tax=Bythopirellula goksoeyrii TaxID=1400387 RepID=A0A5B9Q8T5_9BACT|nr:hypothetical protein Pr1d_05870 [Bythopirellula goksoeyrii]
MVVSSGVVYGARFLPILRHPPRIQGELILLGGSAFTAIIFFTLLHKKSFDLRYGWSITTCCKGDFFAMCGACRHDSFCDSFPGLLVRDGAVTSLLENFHLKTHESCL